MRPSGSCGAFRGASASARAQAQAQEQSASAGPRAKDSRQQGRKASAGCAEHLNSPGLEPASAAPGFKMKPERKTLLKLKLAKACFSFRRGHFNKDPRKIRKSTHFLRENAVSGSLPPISPRRDVTTPGGVKIGGPLGAALGAFLARSWRLFCRGLLLFGVSWGGSGFGQGPGSDFGTSWEPLKIKNAWRPKSMMFEAFLVHGA